jgi:hypothetical protein
MIFRLPSVANFFASARASCRRLIDGHQNPTSCASSLHLTRMFFRHTNMIWLPTPPVAKLPLAPVGQITTTNSRVLSRWRGARARATPRSLGQDAMDVLDSLGVRGEGGRPSRVVPIPRRWDQVLRDVFAGRWWLTSPVHQGERGAAVNTIAEGMPDCFGALLLPSLRKVHSLCRQGLRVRPASGVPCALRSSGGTRSMHRSGISCREDVESCLTSSSLRAKRSNPSIPC